MDTYLTKAFTDCVIAAFRFRVPDTPDLASIKEQFQSHLYNKEFIEAHRVRGTFLDYVCPEPRGVSADVVEHRLERIRDVCQVINNTSGEDYVEILSSAVSPYIVSKFFKVAAKVDGEREAINWHLTGLDDSVNAHNAICALAWHAAVVVQDDVPSHIQGA